MLDLTKLGLTKLEYKTYLILRRLGKSTPGIIIKELQLHRATAYDVLNRLIKKGLVSYITINKKRYFIAEDPSRLLDILTEKESELETEKKKIIKAIEEIQNSEKIKQPKDIAKILTGKEGVKTLMQDILNTNQNFLSMGGELKFRDILPIYSKHWAKEREHKKIFGKLISNYKTKDQWKMNHIRYLPKEYTLPTPIIIYGNKIALVTPDENFTTILIENEKIAQAYRSHFNILWNITKNKRRLLK
ncbi:hypothetical protein J4223_00395 [Candidatus Woesearchaeota archaeon]|nr:hypothetical protein [Candidatus Woesearchaeota archaeon]